MAPHPVELTFDSTSPRERGEAEGPRLLDRHRDEPHLTLRVRNEEQR